MSIVRYILPLFFLLSFFKVNAQAPHESMYFFNKTDRSCMNSITLSSDSVYFFAGSCEDRTVVAKGKWHMNGDTLVLSNFDRKESLPRCKVSRGNYVAIDSARVTVIDYFGHPYTNLMFALFDSAGSNEYAYADSNGTITVSRAKWSACALNYRIVSDGQAGDSVVYEFHDGTNQINIQIDYPGAIELQSDVRPIDFEHEEFILKDGMLYDMEGKVVYDNKYFPDGIGKPAEKVKTKK